MIEFSPINGLSPSHLPMVLGFIPAMLNPFDSRPAREQFNNAYSYGGGWSPFHGFTLLSNGALLYPGDPPMTAFAEAKLRDELIRVHECSWVSITQPDGTFEVCRMD